MKVDMPLNKETKPGISECSILAKEKNETRHNCVGNVIHKELFKRLKFNHPSKRYMHKTESLRANKTHKILWDFAIHIGNSILARMSDQVLINKKKRDLLYPGFYRFNRPRSENKRKQKDR